MNIAHLKTGFCFFISTDCVPPFPLHWHYRPLYIINQALQKNIDLLSLVKCLKGLKKKNTLQKEKQGATKIRSFDKLFPLR